MPCERHVPFVRRVILDVDRGLVTHDAQCLTRCPCPSAFRGLAAATNGSGEGLVHWHFDVRPRFHALAGSAGAT
jgi:hypothetical protein